MCELLVMIVNQRLLRSAHAHPYASFLRKKGEHVEHRTDNFERSSFQQNTGIAETKGTDSVYLSYYISSDVHVPYLEHSPFRGVDSNAATHIRGGRDKKWSVLVHRVLAQRGIQERKG